MGGGHGMLRGFVCWSVVQWATMRHDELRWGMIRARWSTMSCRIFQAGSWLVHLINILLLDLYRKTRFIGATNAQKIPFLMILIDGDNFWLDKLLPIVCDTPKQSEEGKLPAMSYQYCPETLRFRNIRMSKIRWHLFTGGTYKPGFTVNMFWT